MSLELIDGFDHYTDLANLRLKWDASSNPGNGGFAAGRFGGQAAKTGSGNGLLTRGLSAVGTRAIGAALYFAGAIPGGAWPIFAFLDGGSLQVEMRVNGSGTISVTRNGTLLATSSSALSGSTWYYVEFQATIHSSAGAYRVDVTTASGTTTWLTATGANTQATANATTNAIQIYGTFGTWVYVDDLYILNSSGSVNNTLLGECRVFTSLPSADGASSAWTPNSGSAHFSRVNEANPDGDSSYVSSSTTGQIDTYQFADISPTGAVAAVQATLTHRKDDAGPRVICAEYRSSGGANYDGAGISPDTSYGMSRHIWDTDPATSAAWTMAGVNGGEFGCKVVS